MKLIAGGLEETRVGFVGGVIILGFVAAAIFGVVLIVVQIVNGLAKKETRAETALQLKKDVKESVEGTADAVKFIATDKGFHKDLRKEFRPQIILFSILGVMFILMFLGVEM
jgi:hypothetical protein